jgi:trk system potassium uptake protein TrkA
VAVDLGESLDIRAITGFASHPDVLDQAGAADADLLLAVTHIDEVNMVACQVAHSLFDVPTKIARIRNQGYLQARWRHLFQRDHLPIDVVISPEVEVAHAVARRLQVPGQADIIIEAVFGDQLLIDLRGVLPCRDCAGDVPEVTVPEVAGGDQLDDRVG